MSAHFLAGNDLREKINSIMKGTQVRCAVAFWGEGAAQFLFSNRSERIKGARLVCDISMGGTNPKELRALGAPNNTALKHHTKLHAKVYISDLGLVVASANASSNGIGFDAPADLIEAGSFHPADSGAYKSATKWFEQIWTNTEQVDKCALAEAQETWNKRLCAGRKIGGGLVKSDGKSLLDTVRAYPDKFRGIGFAFASGIGSEEQRDEAVQAIIAKDNKRTKKLLSETQREAIREWPTEDVFPEWDAGEIRAWPLNFVCVYRGPRGGISYSFCIRDHSILLDRDKRTILASEWSGFRKDLGLKYTVNTMVQADRAQLEKIFEHFDEAEKEGHLFESVGALADFLDKIEATAEA